MLGGIGEQEEKGTTEDEIWETKETQVRSVGREDPLEESMATHSSILAWRIPWTEEPGGNSPWDRTESDTTEVT